MNKPIVYTSYRTTKQRLFKKLQPFSYRDFSSGINDIISEHRELPLEVAREKRILQSNEVTAFLAEMGEPLEGFGKTVVVPGNRITKATLCNLVQPINDREFVAVLNRIIATNRNLHWGRQVRKIYLRGNEVTAFLHAIGEDLPEKISPTGGMVELL